MNAVLQAVYCANEHLAADPMTAWFASILSGQRQGRGCLPYFLGLNADDFALVAQRFFAHTRMRALAYTEDCEVMQRGALRQQLLDIRTDEWSDLRALLRLHRSGKDVAELYLADILAAGCLGADHLWRDLGLNTRAELGELIRHNFPTLAALNTKDMKWKKFFYKQLCEQQGAYVCRSPSCEQCAVYEDCFGTED
jgi:nitrogen fixation protein NifQ